MWKAGMAERCQKDVGGLEGGLVGWKARGQEISKVGRKEGKSVGRQEVRNGWRRKEGKKARDHNNNR